MGVPSYIYMPNPPDFSYDLFPLEPIKDLERELLKQYAGKSLSFKQLFENDHLDKPFTEKNYKQVLIQMEAENKIKTNPPSEKRKKNTMGENVVITFPK